MTKLWRTENEPTEAQIAEIAELLRNGGVVLLPTDTIYGLHAVATDDGAVARIADIKGRDDQKPFVVLAASLAQLETIGVIIDAQLRANLESLWPAPLTAILPLRNSIAASRGAKTLAVRVPGVAWLRKLVEMTGPITSTSANRSGEAPIETPEQLAQGLQRRLDGVLDAGPLSGEPSVIVDFTGDEPRLIRSGHSFFTQKVWKSLRKSL